MVRAFSMLILLLFISCNNSNGQELREVRKKSEKKLEMAEVKSLDYKSCTELRKFNVNAEKIELKNLGLEEIKCIADYRNVKELDLRWNQIKDVKPLENLKNLEVLKINFNQVKDIKPLLNLPNFKELWLHNNKISNLSGIGKLAKLEHLDVSFNPLKNGVDEISNLKKLKRLELREVPKEIVDYVYENYRNFMIPEKIFIEQRYPELAKKRENEIKYPNITKNEDKIN